jgi:tripartite-type tricarboxylate transporter receptor subunit TctC
MMRLRHLLAAIFVAVAATAVCAKDYPDKPIRLIVPFPPGGTTDLLGRMLASHLTATLGQQVIVDNRAGAGGTIGSDIVAKSAADGYTLMLAGISTQSINSALYKQLPYDPQKDFTPIALFASVPNILVVNPQVPVRSVPELVAYAKKYPGRVNMGSAGNGTTNHLSGELFKAMTHAPIVHVPYKGSGPAMADLLGNQVQLMFDNLPGSLPQVRAGKLRALAVTGAARSPVLPDVPTMAEAGVPGYVVDVWFGVVAPKGLPANVLTRLSAEITAFARDKEVQRKLADQGATPLLSTPAEFADRIRSDAEKWARIVRDAGAKVD